MESPFTGAYEDLIRLILRREQRLLEFKPHTLPEKPLWKRRLLEFPLNFVAASYANLLKILPPGISERFFLKMFDLITKNKYQPVGISIALNSNSASKIYEYVNLNHSEPALWTLASHPPVRGEIRDLNVGLMGAGYRVMRGVHGQGRRFQIMLAVDVMALDTLLLAEEALYAGAMATYHVAIDRLPSSRNVLQKWVFGQAAYHSAAWRLLDALRSRHNIVMIQAGGVAETARQIYTGRELVWKLRQETRKKPWEVSESLQLLDRRFADFLAYYPRGSGGNHWKRLEAYLQAVLTRDPMAGEFSRENSPPCATGDLEAYDKGVVVNFMAAFGIAQERRAELLAAFEQEFKRITPYRVRMFRQVLRRVVRKGVPILILPLDYSLDPKTPILQRDPIALVPGKGKSADAITLKDGQISIEFNLTDDFFIRWTKTTYTA